MQYNLQKDAKQPLQRLELDASVSCIELRVSPWQLADMQRLAHAASWLQRRAAYAHLRPSNLDCRLGFCSCCPVQSSDEGSGVSALGQVHDVPTWAAVWRFAVMAVRSDLKMNANAQRAKALRACRLRQRCQDYMTACSLLYAAKQTLASGHGDKHRSADSERATDGPDVAAARQQRSAAPCPAAEGISSLLQHQLLDLDFFSWLRHEVPDGAGAAPSAAASAASTQAPSADSCRLALAAIAACPHACHAHGSSAAGAGSDVPEVRLNVRTPEMPASLRLQLQAWHSEGTGAGGDVSTTPSVADVAIPLNVHDLAQVCSAMLLFCLQLL